MPPLLEMFFGQWFCNGQPEKLENNHLPFFYPSLSFSHPPSILPSFLKRVRFWNVRHNDLTRVQKTIQWEILPRTGPPGPLRGEGLLNLFARIEGRVTLRCPKNSLFLWAMFCFCNGKKDGPIRKVTLWICIRHYLWQQQS